jgi:hypothetical protein
MHSLLEKHDTPLSVLAVIIFGHGQKYRKHTSIAAFIVGKSYLSTNMGTK